MPGKTSNAAAGAIDAPRDPTRVEADPKRPVTTGARAGKDPWATPAMQQFVRIKKQHPDCVLLFRMGDFYEFFGEDAERVAPELDLKLMHRGNGIPAAGVPYHQRDKYLRMAIRAGFRVAVVDQLEDPKDAKGVVDRGVTQVVSAGTLVDDDLLDADAPNYLAAVRFDDDAHAGLALAELSTGAVFVLDQTPGRVADELARLAVREVLFAEPADGALPARVEAITGPLGAHATARPGWHFRQSESLEAIREQYRVAGTEGFGLEPGSPGVRALGAVVRYLVETQAVGRGVTDATSGSEFQRQEASLAHLAPPRRLDTDDRCRLDHPSLRSLEVERTIRAGTVEGSLLGVFLRSPVGTRCVVRTPMGKRLLRDWLCAPLANAGAIRDRQRIVGALVEDRALADAVAERLASVADVARIAGRVALGRVTPRDLFGLGRSLLEGPGLVEAIGQSPALATRLESLEGLVATLAPLGGAIVSALNDKPPARVGDGELVLANVDDELDEARALQANAGAQLKKYEESLKAEHDLPSLKTGFNRVFGYYIELPAAQSRRAPANFSRKQTLKNAERYITPELKEFEDRVQTAEARALERERIIFDRLCVKAAGHVAAIGRFGDAIGELDALAGLAQKARERGWTPPEITDEPTLSIHAGRHPVLDELLGHEFVPNDAELAAPEHPEPLALITGPNMAGKSTYIRQTALLVLLASVGSFIPADRATIGVCDRIFTRVGADDALHRGQSTFMVEMTETATILNSTTRSLIVLDEIGRGTSTLDGLSLAWAITEFLADQRTGDGTADGSGPRTLFATHYHELTGLEQRLSGRVRNQHVAVNEWTTQEGRREVVFLHRIRPGRADRSYGVHVAELAGLPASVVARARRVLDELSVQHGGQLDAARIEPPSPASGQMALFTEYVSHPAVDRLRELKLDGLSPLEAFDLLRELASEVGRDPG